MSDPLSDPFVQPLNLSTDQSVDDFDPREPHPGEAALLDDAPQIVDPLTCTECGEHFVNKAGLGSHVARKHGFNLPKAPRTRKRAAPKDKAPPSVVLNLQPGKKEKDPQLDAVQERARQLANLIAMLVLTAGQVEDANDIMQGSDAWAKAVRDLAVYEDWLRKLAAGGESSGRVLAWVTFVAATVGMLMPILLRHDVLPDKMAQGFKTAMSIQEAMSGTSQTAGVGV